MNEFEEFCLVDLELAETTAQIHVREIKRFIRSCPTRIVQRATIRRYLLTLKDQPNVKRKALSALKRFFRDYLDLEELVSTFKFPTIMEKPKIVPSNDMINEFFDALPCEDAKTIFLLYATSGLRRNEALTLQTNDVNFERRRVIPSTNNSTTQRTWVTFYNVECEQYLQQYLTKRDASNPKLFQFSHRLVNQWFSTTKEKTGIKISPQRLREWFCSEMGRLGVQDRYVDAFCGRIPKSVLARHYTDYSPEKLKEIYDNAGLKIL